MQDNYAGKFLNILFIKLPMVLVAIGGALLLIYHFFFQGASMPIAPGIVPEMVKIPLDFIDLEIYSYVLETENYLLFQNFESLPPAVNPHLTLGFGLTVWFLLSIGVVLVTLFQRMPFVFSMIGIIFLLTLTGVNSLNIGGLNTNLPLMLLMTGLVLPSVIIHTFFDHWTTFKKAFIILPIAMLLFPLLVYLGEVTSGEMLISENITMVGLAVSAIFMVYIGHAVLSSVFVFLVKLNKGVALKISWHVSVIYLMYLLFLVFLLLKITGNAMPDVPVPPIMILLLLAGVLGYFETKRKIQQIKQPYLFPQVGEGLYLIGFAVTVLVFWKAEYSVNRPILDFMDHVFIYSQIAFSLLFYAYLMANFSGLMNKGGQVEKVIFQPRFFAYYHMRVGAIMAMLSLIVFSDGIIAVQFSTGSTNVSADYYYATDRPREAMILFENSWERYRRNEKALNAVAHLALVQNQPTSALNTLTRGFENSPSVNDILLFSATLEKSGKGAEALTVLENGLLNFPEDPYLLNNLALHYSKNSRGEEAFRVLEQIHEIEGVVNSNKIALQAKHLIHYDESFEVENNLIGKINQLVLNNLKGNKAGFALEINEIEDGSSILSRAILRNQWSNHSEGDIKKDWALIDTLLAHNFVPAVEEELRETRVIRSYQQDHINETLKHLNGLAFQFPNSAGFYHSMAANVLIGQLDFEKAAIELSQAESKGFRNFRSHHLPLLFFGGLKDKTFEIASRHGLAFPDWMDFGPGEELIPNDTTVFFSKMATLHKDVKRDFMSGLEEIESGKFKDFQAFQILLRKGHWLEEDEIKNIIGSIEKSSLNDSQLEVLRDLEEVLLKDGLGKDHASANGFMDKNASLDRNAYWTPLVFMAMEGSNDNLEKYNILLEASGFNKDPLLWITLVKYSRMIGVDSYASSILSQMSEWVDAQTLEELQIKSYNGL